MGKLGDLIPQDVKGILADSTIVVGNVIRCYTNHTNPPKEKRFIILGRDKTGNYIGTVFINSNINFNVINSQELLDLQYPIRKEKNEYLKWDSFIDCSKLVKFDYEYVRTKVVQKPECVLGTVQANDLEIIYQLVKKSPNISAIELQNIGLV